MNERESYARIVQITPHDAEQPDLGSDVTFEVCSFEVCSKQHRVRLEILALSPGGYDAKAAEAWGTLEKILEEMKQKVIEASSSPR